MTPSTPQKKQNPLTKTQIDIEDDSTLSKASQDITPNKGQSRTPSNQMNPQTPEKKENPTTKSNIDIEECLTVPNTSEETKQEREQMRTSCKLELTPLMTPKRLYCLHILPQPNDGMRIVQTPFPYRLYNFHDGFENRNDHVIQTRVLFGDQDCSDDERNSSSHEESENQNSDMQEDEENNMDSKEFQAHIEEEKIPLSSFEFKRASQDNLEEDKEKDLTPKTSMCKCRRTQCLKLYCDCFRDGEVCGESCQCQGCHNKSEYQKQRQKVKQQLLKRNPSAFDKKIDNSQHSKGCNCKRTGCLKRYCECYQAGLQCGQHCKCEECKNIEEEKESSPSQREKPIYKEKKQHR